MAHIEALDPTATVARRVREVRKRRGLTAEQLAARLVGQGIHWDRYTVTKLENGKRQNVTIAELLALSVVLEVAPVHLLVPPDPSPSWGLPAGERRELNDEGPYQLTGNRVEPIYLVRRFVRGEDPLPGMDERSFFSEIPPQEFSPLLEGRTGRSHQEGDGDGEH